MSGWLNSASRDERGSIVVEFAFALPLLLLLLVGIVEIGRAYYQADAVEKGLRAAASYLARNDLPWTASDVMVARNIARTGTLDGSGPVLASGWSDAAASLTVSSSDYQIDATTAVPVVEVSAAVPFDPMLPGLVTLFGLDTFTIRLSHEQAFLNQ
jgi:Flp pilus assembly protein TadG